MKNKRSDKEIINEMINKIIFNEINFDLVSKLLIIDSATKILLLPKSIIFDIDTNKLVNRAYFPNSLSGSDFAEAVSKIRPKMEPTTLPTPTSEILNIDFLNIAK